jgi:hypothetical protein
LLSLRLAGGSPATFIYSLLVLTASTLEIVDEAPVEVLTAPEWQPPANLALDDLAGKLVSLNHDQPAP